MKVLSKPNQKTWPLSQIPLENIAEISSPQPCSISTMNLIHWLAMAAPPPRVQPGGVEVVLGKPFHPGDRKDVGYGKKTNKHER